MKSNYRKIKKIAFWGNFGNGNLGNEATLQAIIQNTLTRIADAELLCICSRPEDTILRHKIMAVPMQDLFFRSWAFGKRNRLTGYLRKVFIGFPSELYRWFKAFKTLRGTNMLIIPGTQILSDSLTGPFGWPYSAFRWSVASKLRRCRLLFVSVGVGPISHPLGRFFIKSALWLADYRSYRDDASRQYAHNIGLDTTKDPVYPDLAFGLPLPRESPGRVSPREKPVVAVGVLDYHGQFAPRPPQHRGDIYRRYLQETVAFVTWLLEHSYKVRLILGDLSFDKSVLSDIRNLLSQQKVAGQDLQAMEAPIDSVEQLVSHLAASDIIVSPRFHNVVLGILVNKPVIALGYQEKFSALMEDLNLAGYCLPIDHFDLNTLTGRFVELEKHSDELKPSLNEKIKKYRLALDEQYKLIFGDA